MAERLSPEAIEEAMKRIPEWELEESSISRTFEFEEYMDGIGFVNKVAAAAEEANHHPDMEVRYGWVDVSLSTHDAEGLTDLDFDLAQKIDSLG
ncbi:MAG: 4a-hydroxytetrahydrobiopterin dehydratase [Verrucomicrobiota bacterium]